MLGDLFRPFAYLTIHHPSRLPLWVNWALPAASAAMVMTALLGFGVAINTFGEQGLLARLLAFVQTLVGFYIAALAAVASFNSRHLDRCELQRSSQKLTGKAACPTSPPANNYSD